MGTSVILARRPATKALCSARVRRPSRGGRAHVRPLHACTLVGANVSMLLLFGPGPECLWESRKRLTQGTNGLMGSNTDIHFGGTSDFGQRY